ncbi:hypothetical protein PAPHI01_1968 [Pancytospora philotis]|nr:hypothetical protein PAPHI01_1968 [Pancytospora philotis]
MRGTTKLTCIAQCLAASLSTLYRAGLIRDEYYSIYISSGTITHASSTSNSYEPRAFSRFKYDLQHLAAPICEGCRLEGVEEGAGDISAVAHYMEWRDQSIKAYRKVAEKYVNDVYHVNSFEKRVDESTVADVANALTKDMERFFSSPERLLKSYEYIRSLVKVYRRDYNRYNAIISAIMHVSMKISDASSNPLSKELESLDDKTIEKLDALREELDVRYYNIKGEVREYFDNYIPKRTLGMADSLDGNFFDGFIDYCKNALSYIYGVQEKVSEVIIYSTVCIRRNLSYLSAYGKDPYVYVHLVYPEMDYKAWGSFLRASQNQVANEVRALQKHVEEVSYCMSTYRSFVPELFEGIDIATEKHIKAQRPDHARRPEEIGALLANEIEAVAEKVFNQTHGKSCEEAPFDEATFAREIEAKIRICNEDASKEELDASSKAKE